MDKKQIMRAGLIAALFLTTILPNSQAADIENGRVLHDESCLRCHQPSLYESPDRKIKNLEQLHNRVQQCELANDLTWFEEEVDDVTEYLNHNYYLFGIK